MDGLTREEFRETVADLKADIKQFISAKMEAMPCAAHGQAIGRIAERSTQALLTATVAEEKAKTAKDLASGNLWKLARWGVAAVGAAAMTRVEGAVKIYKAIKAHL